GRGNTESRRSAPKARRTGERDGLRGASASGRQAKKYVESWFLSGLGNLDLDVVPFDADGVGADLDAWVVGPDAVGEAEAPGVPGAGDDAVLDAAAAQGGAHVRADVVDGEMLAADAEEGDQLATNDDGLAVPFLHLVDFAHRLKLGHVPLPPH